MLDRRLFLFLPPFSLCPSLFTLPSRAIPLPRAVCKRALSHPPIPYLDRSVDMSFPIVSFNANTRWRSRSQMPMTVTLFVRNDNDAACQPTSRFHWRARSCIFVVCIIRCVYIRMCYECPLRLNRGQRRWINRVVGRARENERERRTDGQTGGRKRRDEHAFVG